MNRLTMKKANVALLVMTSFMMVACGGGGGSSDAAAPGNTQVAGSSATVTSTTEVSSTAETASTIEPVAATSASSAVSSTEDLVVTETFLFSSNYKVRVTANLNSAFDHLTVCYMREASDEADYDNCLLRAELEDGVFNGELLVTNDTNTLAVSVWDYEDAANPSVTYWDRDVDGDLILIN